MNCGKSTLLRMIAGLEAVTGGRVPIGGVEATTEVPAKRRVAMVLQSPARCRAASASVALVRNPEVFLFDEPLSNLDALLRLQMRLELAKLHNELKTTIIYVAHDQVEPMTLPDKVSHSAGQLTARFATGSELTIAAPAAGAFDGEQPAELGLRPEPLSLTDVAGTILTGTASVVKRLGNQLCLSRHPAWPGDR